MDKIDRTTAIFCALVTTPSEVGGVQVRDTWSMIKMAVDLEEQIEVAVRQYADDKRRGKLTKD